LRAAASSRVIETEQQQRLPQSRYPIAFEAIFLPAGGEIFG
jgi:hypothetical protein